MGISDRIETFICELLKAEMPGVFVELKRNELASVFNCAPSQINYVIATRFSKEHGYIIESRRGGGGYLRIKKICADNSNPIFNAVCKIPRSIDYLSAKRYIDELLNIYAIDIRAAQLILSAISDTTIATPQPAKDILRANILKSTLSTLIYKED